MGGPTTSPDAALCCADLPLACRGGLPNKHCCHTCLWQQQRGRLLCRSVVPLCARAEAELRKVLPAHEVEAVVLAKHRPNYCLQVGLAGGAWRIQQRHGAG